MTQKKERQLALFMAIILLLVGALCYAAFPVKPPADPIRKIYHTDVGSVMFSHDLHRTETGYGVACLDCHHHHAEDEDTYRACEDCHLKEAPTAVPKACIECHEMSEAHHGEEGLEDRTCNDCHVRPEGEDLPPACLDCHDADEVEGEDIPMKLLKEADAFHTQCSNCHKEYGKGPLQADCNQCHYK